MRYEDASQTGTTGNDVNARDDADHLASNDFGPATGNLITGAGTITGATGTDSSGHIVAIQGAGGSDTSIADGQLQIAGQYGTLTIDADGNYSYARNPGTPEGVSDTFTYTLADTAGATDTANLVINIGDLPMLQAQGNQTIQTNDGTIVLPAGVELSDVRVVGRDLVVTLPDGSTMVIPDGAIFVPQLVLDGVEVPASNLAALLIDAEPKPGAGDLGPSQLSSGGNFALPPGPLDPGVPLGDLIPPTELTYTPPEFEEPGIEPEDDTPAIGAAPITLEVDDDALPDGNNAASGDEVDSDTLTFTAGSNPLVDFAFDTDLGGLGGGLTWSRVSDTVIEGRDGGTLVVTLTLNAPASIPGETSGGVTVTATLANNYDSHPGINADDLQALGSVTVVAAESDGAFVTGLVNVGVSDDVPLATGAEAASGIVVDETTAGSPAGFPISDTSNDPMISGADAAFGADGPAASGSLTFGLSLTGGVATLASGLVTAAGDQAITLNQTNATTITGTYGAGLTAFTLVMNADGTVTYTQNVPLEHSDDGSSAISYNDTNSPLDLDGLVNATVTVKDFDLDTATASVPIGDRIQIFDDGPDAGLADKGVGTVVLDETRDVGTDTADGTSPTGLASDTIDFAGNFNAPDYGADGAGTTAYELVLATDGIGSGLFALEAGDTDNGGDGDGYGQGDEITLSQVGNTITGSVGDVDYFTISIDSTTGQVTFTQLSPIWHSVPGDSSFDELATLNTESAGDLIVQQTVTDSDGDFDTASVDIGRGVFSIQDDGPDPYDPCPDDVISVNDPDAIPFIGSLNLPDVGEDKPGVVGFGVVDGDPVLDTEGNPVTSGEDALVYFINDDGVLEARVGDESGDLIFTITLNGDGTFTYDQIGQIGSGGIVEFKNFDQADAGNTNYLGLGNDDPGTAVDLLMSAGENTDADPAIEDTTVNTDSDSIGAQNQSMDANDSEVLRIDFVTDLQTGGAGPTGFSFSGHASTNSYLQTIPQVQANQDAVAAFSVWALDSTLTDADAPDRDPTDGFSDATAVTITQVTIIDWETGDTHVEDISGLANGATEVLDFGVSVTRNADGSVTFTGIQEGDQYGVATGANEFNAIAVQAVDHSFDLGVFSIGTTSDFTPVDLEVPIVVTDADGDLVTCDIDVHIGTPLLVSDATVTVNEAGLPDIGSNAGSDSEIDSGTLAPTGGTGPYTFTLLSNANGQFGNLVLNPETGEYTYTLDTPVDSQPDADDGTNPELGAESFDVLVTDSLGATHTTTITVNIIDDVPTAVDDTDTIESGSNDAATGNVITDAALGDAGDSDDGADTMGADQPGHVSAITFDGTTLAVPNGGSTEIEGDNGTLTIFSNGNYSYVRADGTPGDAQDVFTYTIVDADGDTAEADLTITIEDAAVTVNIPTGEAETTVYENALGTAPQGTSEAAAPGANDDPNEVVTGTIAFNALDGLGSITIGTTTLNLAGAYPQTIADDATGKLEVTGVTYDPATGDGTVSYKYTLEDNTLGNQAVDGGNTTVTFDVDIVDGDGDHSPDGDLVITIVDDAPIAADDSNSVDEGGSVNGTVLTNDLPGADDYGANKVVGGVLGNNDAADSTNIVGTQIVIDGTYGTLTLHTDGTYTYEADANTDPAPGAKDEFVYTIRDADGDVDSAVLTINLSDITLIADNQNKIVNEAALDLVDDPADLAAGSVVGSNPASGAETVTGQLNVTNAASYAIVGSSTGTHGQIQINSDGSYTYTLTDPVDGPTADNSTNTFDNVETFTYEADDGNGNTVQGTITIDVIDDVPTANPNTDSVSEGGTTTGDVLVDATDDVFGADGPATVGAGVTGVATGSSTASPVTGGLGAPLSGAYGQLTLNANGTYTYEANPDVIASGSVVDHFVYTITDGDGDTSTTTLDITVNDVTLSADNQNKVVNEAALDLNDDGSDLAAGSVTGSNPSSTAETVSGQLDVTNAASYAIVGSSTGTHGQIQINSDGSYTYTLTDPVDGPTADNSTNTFDNVETFTYEADDGNGNTVQGTITIDVIDDVPTAAVSTAGFSIAHDETPGLQDTDVAGPLAVFDSVADKGDDPDVLPNGVGSVIGFANGTGAISSTGTVYGADGAAADPNDAVFSLDVSVDGVDSLLNVTSGESILLHEEGGLIVGRVSGGTFDGQAAFAISIDANTGAISMVQYLSIEHTNTASNDEAATIANGAILATVTVTDGDGDTDSDSTGIGSLISFQDDGPTAVSAAAITTGLTNGGEDTASASLDTGDNNVFNNFGADGGKVIFNAATVTHLEGLDLKHGGVELTYAISSDGQTLTGYVDATIDIPVFTIQLQPGGNTSTYDVTMHTSIDSVTNINFNDGTYDFVGGNDSWAGFVPLDQVEGDAGNLPVNDDSPDLLLTPIGTGTAVNGNANSAGTTGPIAGQNIGEGEGMRLDFVEDLSGKPTPGDYADPGEANHDFDAHYDINGAVLRFGDGTSTLTTASFKAFTISPLVIDDNGDDGTADPVAGDGDLISVTSVAVIYDGETATATFNSLDPLTPIVLTVGNPGGLADRTYTVSFVLDAGSGEYYATVEGIYDINVRIATFGETEYNALEVLHLGPSSADADFAITGFGAAVATTAAVDFTVPISVVDGDGDTVSSGNLAIHATAPTPPIALDTSGDGTIAFVDHSAGVAYDYNGDGVAEATAWVGGGDSILVRDANGDGTVTDASEFVFGGNGVTDMQALAAQYGDTLDANDADFGKFQVWTDANMNGVADAGELTSLADAGITSIGLVSDGIAYTAANGEVEVAGSGTFTRADGSTGISADATFATGSAAKTVQEVERIAANSNNIALAAAVGAAGVVATAPAAATAIDDGGQHQAFVTNAVVGREAVSDLGDNSDGTFSALTALHDGGFEFGTQALATSSHMAISASHIGELASNLSLGSGPNALLDATDMGALLQMPAMSNGMNVAPSLEALVPALAGGNAQLPGAVEQIVADALHGGGGTDINALLNALPGAGIGAEAGLHGLATLATDGVSFGDMGHYGGFTFDAASIITTEAMVLHHDAVQPVANG